MRKDTDIRLGHLKTEGDGRLITPIKPGGGMNLGGSERNKGVDEVLYVQEDKGQQDCLDLFYMTKKPLCATFRTVLLLYNRMT